MDDWDALRQAQAMEGQPQPTPEADSQEEDLRVSKASADAVSGLHSERVRERVETLASQLHDVDEAALKLKHERARIIADIERLVTPVAGVHLLAGVTRNLSVEYKERRVWDRKGLLKSYGSEGAMLPDCVKPDMKIDNRAFEKAPEHVKRELEPFMELKIGKPLVQSFPTKGEPIPLLCATTAEIEE